MTSKTHLHARVAFDEEADDRFGEERVIHFQHSQVSVLFKRRIDGLRFGEIYEGWKGLDFKHISEMGGRFQGYHSKNESRRGRTHASPETGGLDEGVV